MLIFYDKVDHWGPSNKQNLVIQEIRPHVMFPLWFPRRFPITFVSLDIVHFRPSNFTATCYSVWNLSWFSSLSPTLYYTLACVCLYYFCVYQLLVSIYSGVPTASFSYIICSSQAFLYLHVIRIPRAQIS